MKHLQDYKMDWYEMSYKFIHDDPQMMNPKDFDDSLTFPLVLSLKLISNSNPSKLMTFL